MSSPEAKSRKRITGPRLALAALVLAALAVWAGVAGLERRREARLSGAARRALNERRFDDARRDVDAWVALRPRSGAAYYWRAKLDLAAGRPNEALAAMKRAGELGHPRDDLAALGAIVQAMTGRFDGVEPILQKALDGSPDPEPELAEALARAYLANFQFGPATKVIERWMKDAPDDPKPYLWRNEIDLRTESDAAMMIRNYREALRRDPKLADARLGLADRLRNNRRSDEAAVEYDAYLKLKPGSVAGHLGAGQTAIDRGEMAAAVGHFNAVLAVSPNDPTALRELGMIDMRAGRYAQSAARLKAATEADPFEPDLRYNYAKALKLAGDAPRAAAESAIAERLRKEHDRMNELRQGLVSRPDDIALRSEAARWLLDHGHDKEGLEWTELILKAAPGHPETCALLADYHRKKGNVGLANYYKLAAAPAPSAAPAAP